MMSTRRAIAEPQRRVLISGVHSDPDPSPGVGIARSLRGVLPKAELVAVDYSIGSSGLNHPVFDNFLIQPRWSEVDSQTYSDQIISILSSESTCWISGLDVEIAWLATHVGHHPRLLIPDDTAYQSVRKPNMPGAASTLSMKVPDHIPASADDVDIHAFGRQAGWRLWVKGRYHEAYRATGFRETLTRIAQLQAHWAIDDLFIQRHVSGEERAITFAAYDGQLLGAVAIEKRLITVQGKTWAASVSDLTGAQLERVKRLTSDLCWTGGGEIEYVRDTAGTDWILDLNPRFPAYIYGATICGYNLPALLVGAAFDLGLSIAPKAGNQFIRVVHEVPVRPELSLPITPLSLHTYDGSGKHPSSQPQLASRMPALCPDRDPTAPNPSRTFPTCLSVCRPDLGNAVSSR